MITQAQKMQKRLDKIAVNTARAEVKGDLDIALISITKLLKIISNREQHFNTTVNKLSKVIGEFAFEPTQDATLFAERLAAVLEDHKNGHKQAANLGTKQSCPDGSSVSSSGKSEKN